MSERVVIRWRRDGGIRFCLVKRKGQRKGVTWCGDEIPELEAWTRSKDGDDICPDCTEAKDVGTRWA